MSKILITGFSGFVSQHLLKYLSETNKEYEIIGISRTQAAPVNFTNLHIKSYQADLKDAQITKQIINETKPDYLIHLASDSSVAYSWQNPVDSFQNNTNIFLNLVESVRQTGFKCRILSVGSSEEYGIVNMDDVPLSEEAPLNPISPYAVARVSQEMLSKVYASGYGLDIIRTRSFNHIGPGQKDNFVVSSFAKQIVENKKGNKKGFEVGNIDIIRDFLDVRDVVKAYMDILEKGERGDVYNICSGVGYSLKQILEKMMKIEKVDFGYQVNPRLVRPSDNPIIIGNNKKIQDVCNWKPLINIDESLMDIINYWKEKIV
ncbi:GDP-mannose 4,6-dehydratase [Ferruginibacter lapsinanis]|uniref:GDP-mannose 4,6-dehydratase n=1 Tax=Ferruginibacter lapsinanis TaxID=563172 RepID=UPI001E5B72F3|nr:GDP-mannose 4,6-dehydratase [Ferruginibacter lapsinanis]UEG50563.1 GDP-mannose 4,6-dehydratase [Ferruginibacter lapsinanis]